jgi:hypothetical protein
MTLPRYYCPWSEKEEHILLVEIDHDMNDNEIALILGRTSGAIVARRKEIAYRMYKQGNPIEIIIKKTRLSYMDIQQTIYAKQHTPKKCTNQNQSTDLIEIKKDVKELLRLLNSIRV